MTLLKRILDNKRKICFTVLALLSLIYSVCEATGTATSLMNYTNILLVGATVVTGISWKNYWKNRFNEHNDFILE